MIANRRRADEGSALVELAIALPVLILVLVSTVDFARVFYAAMAVTNAARAGAQYGAQSFATSSDNTGMQTAAQNAATSDIGTVSLSTGRLCQCASATGALTASLCTATCASGSHLVVTVSVTAVKVFTTITPFPGIPHTVTITRAAWMRAQ